MWISTNLSKYETGIDEFLSDDGDILGTPTEDKGKEGVGNEGVGTVTKAVKGAFYYGAMGVYPNADPSLIKKQYYAFARRYHSNRVWKDDSDASEKSKNVA